MAQRLDTRRQEDVFRLRPFGVGRRVSSGGCGQDPSAGHGESRRQKPGPITPHNRKHVGHETTGYGYRTRNHQTGNCQPVLALLAKKTDQIGAVLLSKGSQLPPSASRFDLIGPWVESASPGRRFTPMKPQEVPRCHRTLDRPGATAET